MVVKNLDANAIVFHWSSCNCSRVAPSPLCEASVFSLVFSFISKWLFSAIFTISVFNFSNAIEWLVSHLYNNFLLRRGRRGELSVDKLGTNFTYWFIEPKNERSSEIFFGVGKFFIASALPTNGRTPLPEILKPSHSMSD